MNTGSTWDDRWLLPAILVLALIAFVANSAGVGAVTIVLGIVWPYRMN